MTGTWPQPFEGIHGMDLQGMLLSLDAGAILHRELLISMARHLHSAVTVGNPAPVVRRISERLRAPQYGDLVVTTEVMRGQGDDDYRLKGFGIYLGGRKEWAETDAEWAAYKATTVIGVPDLSDEGRLTDTVFYIQYGPDAGNIFRWYNSEAVVLPVMDGQFGIDGAAERTATRATFTRDSLISALADSGFYLRGEPGPLPGDGETDMFVTIRVPSGEIVSAEDATDPTGTAIRG